MAKRRSRTKRKTIGTEAEAPDWLVAGQIALGCLLLYSMTLWFGFSPLDDFDLIARRLEDLGNWANLGDSFTNSIFTKAYYRPLLTLSFRFDAIVGGGSTAMFHFTNVVLHGVCMGLLYAALVSFGLSRKAALLWTALAAAHPIHVHAVAWIPGRNDTMQAALALGLWLTLNQWRNKGHDAWLVPHFILFVLALLTKESAILLPFLLLAADWLVHRDKQPLPYVKLVVGWTVLIVLWLRMRGAYATDPNFQWELLDKMQLILATLEAFTVYIGKYFLPFNLGIMPYPQDQTLIFGMIAIVVLALLLWRCGVRNWLVVGFGVIWVGGTLLLPTVSGALGTTTGGDMEHRMYLGTLGMILILTQLKLPETISEKLVPQVAVGVAVSFAILSLVRMPVYRTQLSFADSAVQTSPGTYFTYLIRGRVHRREGRREEALGDFEKAVSLSKGSASIYLSMGLLHTEMKQLDKAMDVYTRGIQADARQQGDHIVHSLNGCRLALNRGSLHFQAGDYDKAFADYQLVVSSWQDCGPAWFGMGLVHQMRKEDAKALKLYRHAAALGDESAQKKLASMRIVPK